MCFQQNINTCFLFVKSLFIKSRAVSVTPYHLGNFMYNTFNECTCICLSLGWKYDCIDHLFCLQIILSLSNEIMTLKTCSPPPGLEPGSSDCRSGALPTKLQSETSFHRLCCAFIVSVSLHSPPDEPHVVSLVVKN